MEHCITVVMTSMCKLRLAIHVVAQWSYKHMLPF